MKQSDSTFTLFHLHFYNVVKLQYLQICTMLMCIEYYTHVPLSTMLKAIEYYIQVPSPL